MRVVVSVCCLALAFNAAAQEPVHLSPYQAGAGAYFAGRMDQAEKHLTQAIEESPDDPRAYYLRGLNRLRENDLRGAQADLTKGSELEARMGSSSPLVDQSLAGVQGSARLTLERVRRAARELAEVQARQQAVAMAKQQREARERAVLRTDYSLPMEALASRLSVDQARQVAAKGGTPASAPVAAAPKFADPFADDDGNEPSTFTATPAPPEGTMKAGSLLGLVGRRSAEAGMGIVEGFTATVTDLLPAGVGPPGMGPPGMGPPEMGPGGPPPGFGAAGLGGIPADAPASEDPFESDDSNPFGDEAPAVPMEESNSVEEDPFDFGS